MNAGRRSLMVVAIVAAFCGSTVRPGATQQQQARQVTAEACGALTSLTMPDVTINDAAMVNAGAFTPPGEPKPSTVPAFCRVQGVATPTSDSHIEFEVWIPRDTWNGKFQAVGVGGYFGSISYGAMVDALARGYAVEGNDVGHTGGDLSFGLGHPEKVVDWAWRAMHVSAQAGKLVVRNATGAWPQYSYFVGCSSGGHQALSEAQRFPETFDGMIAGNPANNRVHLVAAYLYSWLALHDERGAALVSNEKLQMITKAAVATCGDKDGVIQEPRSCAFDPASLLCEAAENGECLTARQIDAVKKVYRGVHNPRTGERIYAGWTVGTEAGWPAYLTTPKVPMRSEVLGWFLFNNPAWDFRSFDFDKDLAYANEKIGYMAAVNPDLSKFKARGGKLIMYAGGSDPIVPPEDGAAYYESVAKQMGGLASIQDFYRFFTVPGMGHCGGGAGTSDFDMLTALEAWVERGVAPNTILATHSTNGAVDRSRPLCPYPTVARWTGKGDAASAENYTCRAAAKPINMSAGRTRPG